MNKHLSRGLSVWALFDRLSSEEQVAVRLRYGKDLWKWYDENAHLPDREELEKAGADEEFLSLLDTVLQIRKEKNEATNGNA